MCLGKFMCGAVCGAGALAREAFESTADSHPECSGLPHPTRFSLGGEHEPEPVFIRPACLGVRRPRRDGSLTRPVARGACNPKVENFPSCTFVPFVVTGLPYA